MHMLDRADSVKTQSGIDILRLLSDPTHVSKFPSLEFALGLARPSVVHVLP